MSPRPRPTAPALGAVIVALAIGLSAAATAIAIALRTADASTPAAVPGLRAPALAAPPLGRSLLAADPGVPGAGDPPSDPIVAELPPHGGQPVPSLAPAAVVPVATLPPDGSVRGPGDTARLPLKAGAPPNASGAVVSQTGLTGLAVLVVIVMTSLVGGILSVGRGRR